jgi:hypothetical protein
MGDTRPERGKAPSPRELGTGLYPEPRRRGANPTADRTTRQALEVRRATTIPEPCNSARVPAVSDIEPMFYMWPDPTFCATCGEELLVVWVPGFAAPEPPFYCEKCGPS